MFQSPKTTTYVAPAEPIDVNQRYLVKVVELVDQGVSKFADPAEANPTHRIRWVFRMGQIDGTPVLDAEGKAYEHYDYTSNKTSKGKTKTAQSRLWMEALLGPLEDDQIGPDIAARLKDKVAVALFEEIPRNDDGFENEVRLRILRLSPHKAGAKPGASAPMPVAMAVAPETVAF